MTNVFLYAYGNAAANADCKNGPLALQQQLLHDKRFHLHAPLSVDNEKHQTTALHDVASLCTQLALQTQQSVLAGQKFITLGGDHSAAIGSWSGIANAIKGDLGLIWFDAHMDAHTFQTSATNNIHGMPLACLLGHGEPALTQILSKQAKLKPENVVLIGIRSYEAGEETLLKKLGIKIFYMKDIERLGLETVMQEALSIVTKNTTAFGISIDLDGFDPKDAPGTGTAEENGVSATEFLKHFSSITTRQKFTGMDVVEFSPGLDVNNKTESLIKKLCDYLA